METGIQQEQCIDLEAKGNSWLKAALNTWKAGFTSLVATGLKIGLIVDRTSFNEITESISFREISEILEGFGPYCF